MTQEKIKLYFTLIAEYFNGEGIDVKRHNLNKSDLRDFITFAMGTLNTGTATLIVLYVFTLLEEEQ